MTGVISESSPSEDPLADGRPLGGVGHADAWTKLAAGAVNPKSFEARFFDQSGESLHPALPYGIVRGFSVIHAASRSMFGLQSSLRSL